MGPTLKRKKSPRDKVDEMMQRKVDLTVLRQPGTYLDLHEKLTLDLAREYQRAENPDYGSISWANQQRAQEYFNTHGFEQTLDHALELQEQNEKRER